MGIEITFPSQCVCMVICTRTTTREDDHEPLPLSVCVVALSDGGGLTVARIPGRPMYRSAVAGLETVALP